MGDLRRHTKQRLLTPDTEPRPRRSTPTRQIITPAPAPAPAVPPRPHGNLDAASAEQIMAFVEKVWPRKSQRTFDRRRGMRRLLGLMAEFPGATWQQRWLASGFDVPDRPVRELADTDWARGEITHSLMLLCCLRVIRPSLAAFRGNHFVRYHEHFEPAQADPQLEEFVRAAVRVHGRISPPGLEPGPPHLGRPELWPVQCYSSILGVPIEEVSMRVRRSVGMRLLTAARVLVAVMLLRPPSDTTGGFGVDEPPGYVYGCPVCDAEIPRRTEAIESGQEPPCKKNRAHGQVTLLRQV